METQLAVSVIIPTYNREAELKQTLSHLLEQTTRQFEIIVVDNSSVDNTAGMVASMAEHTEIPIRYFVKPPNGPPSAFKLPKSRDSSSPSNQTPAWEIWMYIS